jgi:peptidoglycan biosynthesis protein MviN/MurJ (putative lipid II flippase)
VSIGTTLGGAGLAFVFRSEYGLPGIAVGATLAFVANYAVYVWLASARSGGSWLMHAKSQYAVIFMVVLTGLLLAQIPSPAIESQIAIWWKVTYIALATVAVSALTTLLVRRRDEGSLLGAR